MKRNIVVAITGASGATYSIRLLEVLLAAGCDVHLSISDAARTVLEQELDITIDLEHFDPAALNLDRSTPTKGTVEPGTLRYHHYLDFLAPMASGSFPTDGMVVCPCSCGTLSAIAHGASANLIHRAADVHLKERRRLILVPRETPLSLPQIENMRLAALAGAVVLPASPGFYHGAKSIGDLVDFVVSRICDQLGVANTLIERWGES
jgi:4-hydroxy-3-polyprenylbenzoate decarboxylase